MKRLWILMALTVLGAAAVVAAVPFDHSAHLEYVDNDCATCHREGAKSVSPDLEICAECHDQEFVDDVAFPSLKTHGPVWALNHRPYAKLSDFDCAVCHQQVDCLQCHKSRPADEFGEWGNNMINVHRSDFHITHPIAARTDQQLCASCHEAKFCSDCHNDFRLGRASGPSHRRTFDLGVASGVSAHANFEGITVDVTTNCDACHLSGSVATDFSHWAGDHKREARKNLASCQACHPGGDVCLRCHSDKGGSPGFNPHGSDWGDRADRLKDASNGKTCRKCH